MRSRKAFCPLVFLGLSTLLACGAQEAEVCQSSQKLVRGSADTDVLAMSADQKRAVGRVRPVKGLPGFFCTGVRVAPRWVLTAEHCQQGAALTFELPETVQTSAVRVTSSRVVPHPEHDVLLFEIDEPFDGSAIGVIDEPIDESWVTTPLQLAGYGVVEDGSIARELEFLVERVTSIDATTLVVDGEGRSGACVGDSGGPILTRNRKGDLVVVGVLTTGSASCRNIDRYVRGDALADWVLEQTGVIPDRQSGCGALGGTGFCRRGTAMWCDGGEVRTEHCADKSVCGWDALKSGFRCVPPAQDACSGVDDFGTCAANRTRRCVDGRVMERSCGACGLECAWDATLGHVDCLAEL